MRKALIVAVLALAAARASAAGSGTSGADFLTIEQGARALGMGGAFSALADDANALWWNPAGLARSPYSEVTLSHTAYLQSVATEYLGFVRPYAPAHGTFGASVLYMDVPGIDGFDANGNSTGKLSAGAYVGSLSYAATVVPGLTVGATGKYASQKLGSTAGSGAAGDLGAQYWDNNFGVGFSVQNLGPSFKIGSASDPLPRTIRGGGFYRLTKSLSLAFDEEKPYNDSMRAHLGTEWAVTQGIRVRTGFQQTPNAGGGAGFTVGFGLAGAYGGHPDEVSHKEDAADAFRPFWERFGSATSQDFPTAVKNGAVIIGIDYAFVSYGDLSSVHRVSLSARF